LNLIADHHVVIVGFTFPAQTCGDWRANMAGEFETRRGIGIASTLTMSSRVAIRQSFQCLQELEVKFSFLAPCGA